MNEKGIGVLEKYDLGVIKTGRTRGAVLCETNKGYKLLKEYSGTLQRITFEEELLKYIRDNGYYNIDCILRNKENELITADEEGNLFVIKDWYIGRESDVGSKSDIYQCAEKLARIHNITCNPAFSSARIYKDLVYENLIIEYEKHNRELKRVRTFMRSKRRKNEFEVNVLNCFDTFYSLGEEAKYMLINSPYIRIFGEAKDKQSICHGNYNYHNIIFTGNEVAITNFGRATINILITDLYNFLRKVMEKHNWNLDIGYNIIESYNRIRPISNDELKLLYIMLLYPEKFWKIVNYYYNSNKAWIPGKNTDKLKVICWQNDLKNIFLKELFQCTLN